MSDNFGPGVIALRQYWSRPEAVQRGREAMRTRARIAQLKRGHPAAIRWWAARLKEELEHRTPGVLVAAPPSRPGNSPTRAMIRELERWGYPVVKDAVRRTQAVPSSHRRRRNGLPGLSEANQVVTLGLGVEGARLDGCAIYVIDDVLTTGATLEAVATLLETEAKGVVEGWIVAAVAMYTPVPAEVLWVDRITKTSRGRG